jgi:hypothetical protein
MVVSVLAALLLWLVTLASLGALVFLAVAAAFRGRIQRLMDRKMARCKEMFSSWAPATAAAPSAPGSCSCSGTTGRDVG